MSKPESRDLAVCLGILASAGAAMAQPCELSFGEPENLGPAVNSSYKDRGPSLSADGLTLYFGSDRPGGEAGVGQDLWMTTRASASAHWQTPVNLGPTVNSPAGGSGPSISADGLTLYFASNRSGGFGSTDLWLTTRSGLSEPWQPPVNLGAPVNTSYGEWTPSISADGLTLYFGSSIRPGGEGDGDLWMTTRVNASDPWQPPVNLGAIVNSPAGDNQPYISPDGLTLHFTSERPEGFGSGDLWMTTRASTSDPWRPPVNLGDKVNTSSGESGSCISADGLMLFFNSRRAFGDQDLYQGAVTPNCVGDLYCDGEVDLQEYSAFHDCLAGPGVPMGDGCECFDIDGSGDIDLFDFAELQTSFTGPLP